MDSERFEKLLAFYNQLVDRAASGDIESMEKMVSERDGLVAEMNARADNSCLPLYRFLDVNIRNLNENLELIV